MGIEVVEVEGRKKYFSYLKIVISVQHPLLPSLLVKRVFPSDRGGFLGVSKNLTLLQSK